MAPDPLLDLALNVLQILNTSLAIYTLIRSFQSWQSLMESLYVCSITIAWGSMLQFTANH